MPRDACDRGDFEALQPAFDRRADVPVSDDQDALVSECGQI